MEPQYTSFSGKDTLVGWTVRQIRNCGTHIVDNGSQPAAQTLDYSASTTTIVFPIADIFSSFIDEADCGTVTCSLKNNDCVSPYMPSSDNEITIDGSTFAVTLKRNIQAGYGPTTICV